MTNGLHGSGPELDLGDLATRGTPVGDRVKGLGDAVGAARGRVPDALLDDLSAAAEKATGRLRLSSRHTVVAIAGATGSGKSSTYNALTGLELSSVGIRRPTTSWATAGVWGSEGAGELLDWLGIPPRHPTMRDSMLDTHREDGAFDGVVLLDLPDHDSTEVSHHLEVDRLIGGRTKHDRKHPDGEPGHHQQSHGASRRLRVRATGAAIRNSFSATASESVELAADGASTGFLAVTIGSGYMPRSMTPIATGSGSRYRYVSSFDGRKPSNWTTSRSKREAPSNRRNAPRSPTPMSPMMASPSPRPPRRRKPPPRYQPLTLLIIF